jgi:hypothetical protein
VTGIVEVWNDRHNLLAGEFKAALSKEMGFAEEEILGETHFAKPIEDNNLVLYFDNYGSHF